MVQVHNRLLVACRQADIIPHSTQTTAIIGISPSYSLCGRCSRLLHVQKAIAAIAIIRKHLTCICLGGTRHLPPPPSSPTYVCMYVCKDSAAPAHARTRAHRPAAPRQNSPSCHRHNILRYCYCAIWYFPRISPRPNFFAILYELFNTIQYMPYVIQYFGEWQYIV